MTLLAIDPGKRIGYALFTDTGEEIERGVIQFDNWLSLVGIGNLHSDTGMYFTGIDSEWSVTQLVVEGFRHDPNVKQGGSLHEASQIIGSVKTLAALTRTPLDVQFPNILPVAQIIAGYKPPTTRTGKKKHLPDQDSAYLHGMYWLRGQGLV